MVPVLSHGKDGETTTDQKAGVSNKVSWVSQILVNGFSTMASGNHSGSCCKEGDGKNRAKRRKFIM